jgi:hypothetical protein
MNCRNYFFAAALMATLAAVSEGRTVIGEFDGGVAETGWGRFNNGVQPLNSDVYTVTDLGDGGALETDIAGFSDSFGYSFTTAGTSSAFFDSNFLIFDLIYRGEATDIMQGGFSQVFQVLFQSNFNSFALTAYQQNADGVALSSFGAGGTSRGWAPGTESVQTVERVVIDYRSFKETLPEGFVPTTLQFWMSTNDSNRIFKAIDNVRVVVPEPATFGLVLVGCGMFLGSRRRRGVDELGVI